MYGRKVYIPARRKGIMIDYGNASARRILGEINKLISRRGDDLNNALRYDATPAV